MAIARILYQSVIWKSLFYVSAFVLNIVIARHFEASVSGNIYYIVNILTLVHLATSLSLEAGIGFFVSKKELDPARLLNFAVLWAGLLGSIVFIVLHFFLPVSYQGIGKNTIKWYAVLFICGNILFTYVSSICYARNNFVLPNVVSLFHNLLLIIAIPVKGISVVPGISNENYFHLFFAAYLSQAVITALLFKLRNRGSQQHGLPTMAELNKLWQFSVIAFAGNIAFFFLYRVDYLFVEKYCSPMELGNYIQVSKLGQLFFLLPTMLSTAIFPLTAADELNQMPRRLAAISRIILFLYAIVCLILALIGRWLFPAVFGESFSEMYTAFLWLIPGILSLSILFTVAAYNGGKNKQKKNLVGCLLALVFVVLGNWIFVPRFGINAAAAVSSGGYMIYVMYILHDFNKDNHVSINSFFVFRWSDILDIKRLLTSSNGMRS